MREVYIVVLQKLAAAVVSSNNPYPNKKKCERQDEIKVRVLDCR